MTGSTTTKRSTKLGKLDRTCAEAAELARAAARETVDEGQLGEYLSCEPEGERIVTHYFACTHPGYVGWRWAVTVARASRQRTVTVDEVALVPGPGALVSPEWLPWHERVRPGDLGAGDLLPAFEDDSRLVPGYTDVEGAAEETEQLVVAELGLGRHRVLSTVGRDDAAERWYAGSHGPQDPIAQGSPASCATCGFFVRVSGQLGQVFGVCANAYAPRDGQVVSADFGCGAHSEAVGTPSPPDSLEPVFDTISHDDV